MTQSVTVGLTGAGGYIGSSVGARPLDAGHELVSVDNFQTAKVESIDGQAIHEVDVRDRVAVREAFDDEDAIREVAERFADGEAFFFIGRRLGHPVSLEGALKLKEIAYDHAEGFPAGELKHGPLALVTPKTPVLAVVTEGPRPHETFNNVKEVESRVAPTIGFTSIDDAEKYLDEAFEVPDWGELKPLVTNVYLQLFAYPVARSKGRLIDKPRNLAKNVTVE